MYPRCLSVETGLKLFHLKIAPIATYGLALIWKYLTLENLRTLDRVKCVYLKRLLSVSPFTRNRYAYLMANCPTFIEEVKCTFSLPTTHAYQLFLDDYERKFSEIDPTFYQ